MNRRKISESNPLPYLPLLTGILTDTGEKGAEPLFSYFS